MRSHLPHRKDANHNKIKAALEEVGFSVLDLHTVGCGAPDLLVSKLGLTCLAEVKTPTGKLNADQKRFIARWNGRVEILTSVDDVIRLEKLAMEKERAA